MVRENEKPKKRSEITEEYKILQELKRVVDELKQTNAKLELLCSDIKRNRGV